MEIKDLICGLKSDYQKYTQQVDILKKKILERVSSWASDPEINVSGSWESILSVSIKVSVLEKETGERVNLDLGKLMKGKYDKR